MKYLETSGGPTQNWQTWCKLGLKSSSQCMPFADEFCNDISAPGKRTGDGIPGSFEVECIKASHDTGEERQGVVPQPQAVTWIK